ncbi:MAG TPA: DAK2 domain-containing protein [Frankiaceae bacterium]|nr:DAK2 domain-containing protein [Frankiaceae bacterium]
MTALAALDRLDAAAVRRWLAGARDALDRHRAEIDDLNVYPVPDGDTGTNLCLTMASVADALPPEDDLPALLNAAARGALLGARGNSGVILSQILRGAADAFGSGSAADVQKALRRAAETAYGAVASPVEGTILSVVRAAADAAETADPNDLRAVVTAACLGATEALRQTTAQLPALAAAGVVDAGGRGLCVVLDALAAVVCGEAQATAPALLVPRDRTALAVARESGSDAYAYEVQYLLDAESVDGLKAALAALGDSLVVVGCDGLWNVHVHVNDVGAAIEAGIAAGRPHRITVTRFADQIAAAAAGPDDPPASGRAVVAVVQGEGLAELYEAAGATVVTGGPSACPATGQLLDAVLATGAAEVVLLPNDGNVHAPAAAAAAEARAVGRDVHVVPTRSPVQGLAALAVMDPGRNFGDDAIAMSTAASGTRWAEVTVAARDAQTTAGFCRAGDVLGLVDGDVAVIGNDLAAVAWDVIERMLAAGGELVTVVTGAGAPAGLGDVLAGRVAAAYPLVEAEVHRGGQPHYPLLLGVE